MALPDAYKIRHTLEEINAIIEATYGGDERACGSSQGERVLWIRKYGWSFTLNSFARLYADIRGVDMDTQAFARRLWGDMYFNEERARSDASPAGRRDRSLVQFILEPLYKIYSQAVGEHQASSPACRARRDAQTRSTR